MVAHRSRLFAVTACTDPQHGTACAMQGAFHLDLCILIGHACEVSASGELGLTAGEFMEHRADDWPGGTRGGADHRAIGLDH